MHATTQCDASDSSGLGAERQAGVARDRVPVLDGTAGMELTPHASAKRVLLVEDDDVLRNNYQLLLEAHHFSVSACAGRRDAVHAFNSEVFDIIILDVTLGNDFEAGFDLCQAFREHQKITPIIFLTEHDSDLDRVSGLRLGADDYLNKTISGTYLVARINALIRRVQTLTSGTPEAAQPLTQDKSSRLRMDERLSRAYWDSFPLNLSLTQFWILRDLATHPGEVRSIDNLMRAANITVQPNTIVVHIKAIREEIQKLTPDFACIKSERARGYRWLDDPTP